MEKNDELILKNQHMSINSQKIILVTGASTGIGRDIAEVLSAKGELVFAGARKQSDIDTLNKISNITALRLDVTNDNDIREAVEFIEAQGRTLDVLVNNAGIVKGGPLVEIPEMELRSIFEVNLFGAYKMTKACFPLLYKAKGRIINVSSVSGKFTAPFLGPYCMTKHALESYSDALRQELQPLGMKVSIIEPADVKTPLWNKGDQLKTEVEQWISPLFQERGNRFVERAIQNGKQNGMPVSLVSKAICHAIYSSKPKTRYPIVEHRFLYKLLLQVPDPLLDKLFQKE